MPLGGCRSACPLWEALRLLCGLVVIVACGAVVVPHAFAGAAKSALQLLVYRVGGRAHLASGVT